MSDKVREGFKVHIEREYANDDGLHWARDATPFICQNGDGRVTWLGEEWDLWQAAHAAGRREGVEECIALRRRKLDALTLTDLRALLAPAPGVAEHGAAGNDGDGKAGLVGHAAPQGTSGAPCSPRTTERAARGGEGGDDA